jgi:hypothetical protein
LVHVFLQKLSGTTSQLSARFKRWKTVDTLNIALHHETVTEGIGKNQEVFAALQQILPLNRINLI